MYTDKAKQESRLEKKNREKIINVRCDSTLF